MRNINILSLVQAFSSLEEGSYSDFLSYYGIEIKDKEVGDLEVLIGTLCPDEENIGILNQFYVSYKIPQIGKEFDLLRFGSECVINIELKSESTKEKVLKQLKRNRYYLSYLGKKIYHFSFVADTRELYRLRDDGKLRKVESSSLNELLKSQNTCDIIEIDDLFNPSNYLVSPFNSTQKFLENSYFLTNQQEQIKGNIVKKCSNNKSANFMSVTGSAGTGKTLLIYDIVKGLRESKETLIIHCGNLNQGQYDLIEDGWDIIPIKKINSRNLSDCDVVFIDEVQRIYPGQLKKIVDEIKSTNGNCIFSYDKLQTLSRDEAQYDINSEINNITSINSYHLSEKIRSNKEIATFIKALFDKSKKLDLPSVSNIELNYFDNDEDAKDYITSLYASEWEILRFTPSQYNREHHAKYSIASSSTSHSIIGQEFDNVAVMIDRFFSYNEDDKLIYKGSAYYEPVKMLFQNITRTRKKLNLVIINNDEIMSRCVSILKG